MSRIFDALRRSEGERLGTDAATLPQGPDLLQRAERRAASKWDAVARRKEAEKNGGADDYRLTASEAAAPVATALAAGDLAEGLSADERQEILSKFESLQISLPPQSRLVCLTDRENPTAEALRLLAVRLRDIRGMRPLKKVLITSTIPQEGKSMIAANIACALADASDEKVLLLEGDLRRPSLPQTFGIQRVPGICQTLQGENGSLDNIYKLDGAGLWILPAGKAPSNPLELLQSQKLPGLVDLLAACFDWIIIDSPPVLPLADASIWMRLADGILLVARQGVTEKQQLQKGFEAIDPQKLLGALLNGTVASAYSGYYYRSSIPT